MLFRSLVPLGMSIESSEDRGGTIIISYLGINYRIIFNDNQTFNISWSKNIARALTTFDSIGMYRKIVVAMGIIGYNVQQFSNNKELKETNTKIYCKHCNTELDATEKFCGSCGAINEDFKNVAPAINISESIMQENKSRYLKWGIFALIGIVTIYLICLFMNDDIDYVKFEIGRAHV